MQEGVALSSLSRATLQSFTSLLQQIERPLSRFVVLVTNCVFDGDLSGGGVPSSDGVSENHVIVPLEQPKMRIKAIQNFIKCFCPVVSLHRQYNQHSILIRLVCDFNHTTVTLCKTIPPNCSWYRYRNNDFLFIRFALRAHISLTIQSGISTQCLLFRI